MNFHAGAGFLVFGLAVGPSAAGVIHVDANLTSGANDGTSWTDAFRGRLGLQSALMMATAGDEVWVADGWYAPASAAGDGSESLVIPDQVAVLGGFAGGEASASQRDPGLHETVLSGDLQENDGKGVFDHTGDNSWHVVRIVGGEIGTAIDGFTIRDALGFKGHEFIDLQGGGILIEGGAPLVSRCAFTDNRADFGAGIAVLDSGAPTIEDCVFTHNESGWRGGGIYLAPGSDAAIRRCDFEENQGSHGVGLYCDAAAATIEDCDFTRNTSPISAPAGGGVGAINDSTLIIRGCRFVENQSQGGGGVHLFDSHLVVDRCRFVANIGTGDGGDAVVLFNSGSLVSNSEFIGTGDRNDLDPSGILVIISQGARTSRFVNCTFTNNGNSAGLAGPFSGHSAILVFTESGTQRFENCVIWGNFSALGDDQIVSADIFTPTVFDRCLVENWDGTLMGTGILSTDPLLVDADGADNVRGTEDDDVRLATGSSCIDAGVNAFVPPATALDVAGLARFRDDPATPDTGAGAPPLVDLGAHEYQPPPCAGDANADGTVDFGDITHILANWKSSFSFGDITAALANWGAC